MHDRKRISHSIGLGTGDCLEPHMLVEAYGLPILLVHVNPRCPMLFESSPEQRAPYAAASRLGIDEEHFDLVSCDAAEPAKSAAFVAGGHHRLNTEEGVGDVLADPFDVGFG